MATDRNQASSKDEIEYVVKVAALVSAIVYGAGYIAVQLNFLRYNYQGLTELLSAHYIAAGLWFLVPVLIGAALLRGLVSCFAAMPSKSKLAFARNLALFALLIVAMLGVAGLAVLRPEHPWISRQDVLSRVLITSIVAAFLVSPFLGAYYRWATQNLIPTAEHSLWLVIREEVNWTSLIFFVAIYVGVFEFVLYPVVPQALGGGSIRRVQLAVEPGFRDTVVALGIPFSSTQSHITDPLSLLTETKERYVIIVGTPGIVVEIPKTKATLRELGTT